MTRVPAALAVCAALSALTLATVRDARARRDARAHDNHIHRAAARLVGPELALHAAAPWLRHPTRTPPWTALDHGPAALDTDPAGATSPPSPAAFAPWAGRGQRR